MKLLDKQMWYKVQGTRYKVQGTRYKVQGTRYKVQGTRYKVQGTGYKVQGIGYNKHSSLLWGFWFISVLLIPLSLCKILSYV
jgi:hypothetical protein